MRTPRVTPLGATTRSGLDSRGPCLRPWLSERLPLPLAHPDGEGRCIYGSCRGTEPHLLGMGYPTFSLESPSWLRSLSTRGSAEERASVRETPLPLRSRTACCTEIRKTEKVIFCADAHATRTEFGRPRSSIRLRTSTAMAISVAWASVAQWGFYHPNMQAGENDRGEF